MGRADAFIEFGCSFEGKVSRAFILQKIGGNVQNYVDTGYNYWETDLIIFIIMIVILEINIFPEKRLSILMIYQYGV